MIDAIRSGAVSAVEATQDALDRIARSQPELNAFTVILADEALAAARAADARIAAGDTGPLLGVPVSVKDHIWMTGTPATNGSLALRDFVPPQDAVVVTRLREAGAVIVGKTNNPEFCYRSFTDNPVFGPTRNPRALDRTPGGSSGGAGAAVAARLTDFSLGTDGGGSIRIPASFCGVVGHKPTFGLVPKEPGFKGWKSLSVDGPLATSVRGAALLLGVIAGRTAADDTTQPFGPSVFSSPFSAGGLDGLRVAYSADLGGLAIDSDVREAFERALPVLESLGAILVEAAPPFRDPAPIWNTIAFAEGYASEGPLLETWRDSMYPGTAEIIEAGRDIPAWQYVDALHERATLYRQWDSFFDSHDVLVTPTMPVTAFPIGLLGPATVGGEEVDPFFDDWCALSLPANLTGMPATSVPMGTGRDNLPVGLQIMGPRWTDARTLRVAAAFEAATGS